MLEWIYEWSQIQPKNRDLVALDIGANNGGHSLWMSRVCGMFVNAFEPVIPDTLNANVDLNGGGICVWPWGLGNEQAEYHHTGKGVLKRGKSRESTDEVLHVVRLDDLVSEAKISKTDLWKVDVEGLEVDVLRGGMATIERDRPVILTEEWETKTTNEIGKLLKPLGYRRTHAFGGKGRAPVGVWESK